MPGDRIIVHQYTTTTRGTMTLERITTNPDPYEAFLGPQQVSALLDGGNVPVATGPNPRRIP